METSSGHARRPILLGLLVFLTGCSSHTAAPPDHSGASIPGKGEASQPRAALKRVSDRPANTQGTVFVPEYHHIEVGKGPYFRSPEQFRADLQHYYDLGFRPVLASEYLSNTMTLPPGASPIVLTFDDALPSQLQLGANGEPTSDCAVGMWQDFAKTHPDFPVHATFFVLPALWCKGPVDPRKVKLVQSLGSEIANHTMTHPHLSHLTDAQVQWQLGTANDRLDALGQPGPHPLALPYGISPKNRGLLKGFDWKGKHVSFSGVFLVGANPAPSPENRKFNPYRVPRIIACPGPYGIDFWLEQLQHGKVKPYVAP